VRGVRKAPSTRPQRVASVIQGELGMILARGELKDPRLAGLITITGVKLSPDLKEGVVYYSVFGTDEQLKSTQEGLDAAAGFLKTEVGRAIQVRYTPRLRFVYDESVARGDRIEQLLRQVRPGGSGEPGPGTGT
jgi:ribosome-binding factor A